LRICPTNSYSELRYLLDSETNESTQKQDQTNKTTKLATTGQRGYTAKEVVKYKYTRQGTRKAQEKCGARDKHAGINIEGRLERTSPQATTLREACCKSQWGVKKCGGMVRVSVPSLEKALSREFSDDVRVRLNARLDSRTTATSNHP
jgi:hypothetical protein